MHAVSRGALSLERPVMMYFGTCSLALPRFVGGMGGACLFIRSFALASPMPRFTPRHRPAS